MEGRTFQVSVTVTQNVPLGLPPSFDNCYTFGEDNVYVDPLFPSFDPATSVPGTWEQHSVGASTSYSAAAANGPLVFTQDGQVTPARGNGVLQLTAYAEISLDGFVLAGFESVGFENPTCFEDVFGGG
jgi:hypothetical protein